MTLDSIKKYVAEERYHGDIVDHKQYRLDIIEFLIAEIERRDLFDIGGWEND